MATRKIKIVALTLVACGLAVLVGYGTGCKKKAASDVKLAFVTNNPSDFWQIARKGVEKAQKEFNIDVEFKVPAGGAAAEQQTIVEDLISMGVQGMAISPVSPANQTEMLNKAAAKMAVFCQDSDAPASNRLCYVGTNNYEAGKATGNIIKSIIPKGDIMLFVGTLEAANARDRRQGILDSLKGSAVKVVDTRTDNTDRAKAKANVEDALVKYPNLVCLVGLWSYNGPIIAGALKESKAVGRVKAVCFDEEVGTLQAVKDGIVYATVVQRPFEMGYQSMRILAAHLRGDKNAIPASKSYDTGIQVIMKDNLDAFWAELKELTKKD